MRAILLLCLATLAAGQQIGKTFKIGEWQTVSITVAASGETRSYLLYIPNNAGATLPGYSSGSATTSVYTSASGTAG